MKPPLPPKLTAVPYANVGTSELFVHRITDIRRLLDASLIDEPQRGKANEAMMEFLLTGLLPAFDHLKKIRTHASAPPPEMNRRQAHEDFMRTLWHTYKDLLPKATRQMGFDIGFLYQNDANFETGWKAFAEAHPTVVTSLVDHLRFQRSRWQNKLKLVRNDYLEHRTLKWEDVQEAYSPQQAAILFEAVWKTAEDVLVCLIRSKFPEQFDIVEIPASQRNPEQPDRFRFIIRQPIVVHDKDEPEDSSPKGSPASSR